MKFIAILTGLVVSLSAVAQPDIEMVFSQNKASQIEFQVHSTSRCR